MTLLQCSLTAAVLSLLSYASSAQTGGTALPRIWVDKDTGHRIWRLSDEPDSGGFYFNVNAYTPDGQKMIYTAPDGIHVLELATRKTRLLVASATTGRLQAIVVGHKTDSLFYTISNPATGTSTVYKADVATGQTRKLVELPPHTTISTVNADETLAAGTYIEGDATGKEYGSNAPSSPTAQAAGAPKGPHYQPPNKAEMMRLRLAARLPLVLFTLRLEPGPGGEKPGTMRPLLHSTDWVNHLLFSPTDPELLMYCHEGSWEQVDRIWTIHTDGTQNTLIHKRTMLMEIAGHEFWGLDGETIWYDWQYPRGEDFFLAGYNLKTHRRTAYHLQRNDWSIHFNLTQDLDLFTGDGGDAGHVAKAPDAQWIELFHPELIKVSTGALDDPSFVHPGVFHSEHLVNMLAHNYREEPNVRFSPDKSLVIFTSNIFGPSYVFGVEVKKAVDPPASDLRSTTELGRRFRPGSPPRGK